MSHLNNLSISSISSLIEPTTPPNVSNSKSSAHSAPSKSVFNLPSPLPVSSNLPESSTPESSNLPETLPKSPSSAAPTMSKSVLWDSSNKLNNALNLPNFNIDQFPRKQHPSNKIYMDLPAGAPSFGATPDLLAPQQGPDSSVAVAKSRQSAIDASFDKENSRDYPAKAEVSYSNNHNQRQPRNNSRNTRNFNSSDNNRSASNHSANSSFSSHNRSTSTHTSSKNASANSTISSDSHSTSNSAKPATFAVSKSNPDGHVKAPHSEAKIDKEYLASINKLPLAQIKSEILKLAKDQYGCRFLQKKIDENLISSYQLRLSNFEIIFKQIHPYLYELIIDPFGNYLIQKLINYCSELNLNLILEILQYNLFQISINQHGTRALQKIIDNLNNNYQLNLLTKGLKSYIIELIKDLNGNHVIQKILNKYQPIDCQFIYDAIIADLYVVATHKHGCCVLQKCLNHVTLPQLNSFSKCILNFSNFQLLINDQFGNYVLQYLISINSLDINYKIFHNFVKYGINNLCNLKFSSNVIEKFLKNCFNNEILDLNFSNLKFELIHSILINDLNKLINDPYGNYVIQTLIDILVNPQVSYESTGNSLSSYSVEKLSLLLPPGNEPPIDMVQIVIIKYWFQNCKIISSFGKRIQSKINIILSNTPNTLSNQVKPKDLKSHGHSYSVNHPMQHQQNHQQVQQHVHQQNHQSNHFPSGHQNQQQLSYPHPQQHIHSQSYSHPFEFVLNDGYLGSGPPNSYRSLSVSSTPSNADSQQISQPNRNLSLPGNFSGDNYIFTPESIGKSGYKVNSGSSYSNDYVINEPQFGFPQRQPQASFSSSSPPVDSGSSSMNQLNQPQPYHYASLSQASYTPPPQQHQQSMGQFGGGLKGHQYYPIQQQHQMQHISQHHIPQQHQMQHQQIPQQHMPQQPMQSVSQAPQAQHLPVQSLHLPPQFNGHHPRGSVNQSSIVKANSDYFGTGNNNGNMLAAPNYNYFSG